MQTNTQVGMHNYTADTTDHPHPPTHPLPPPTPTPPLSVKAAPAPHHAQIGFTSTPSCTPLLAQDPQKPHMQSMVAIFALYNCVISSFAWGVSGQLVLGVTKWVVVRHTGHVRKACGQGGVGGAGSGLG